MWVPSHIGLIGNEKADEVAKRALGYNLITPVPISLKTFKIITLNSIKQSWKLEWSNCHPDIKIRRDILPFATESRTSRREEILLCRLRTGITMLTDIVPHINGVWPQICEACDTILSIDHILIHCIEFERQ